MSTASTEEDKVSIVFTYEGTDESDEIFISKSDFALLESKAEEEGVSLEQIIIDAITYSVEGK